MELSGQALSLVLSLVSSVVKIDPDTHTAVVNQIMIGQSEVSQSIVLGSLGILHRDQQMCLMQTPLTFADRETNF